MKRHIGFIIFFTFTILFYFWDVIFMRSAFLGGDYAAQFYPWSKIYAETIKNFHFPYWTRYFHCGFPLMAEGQVGGYYPFNLIFFFSFPFKAAYNYIVVFHFILAGVFTYLYARKLGSCQWGGSLAALLFCFGSAYAGCFYNTVTVKTLIWFPLVLFFFEEYFDKKRAIYMLGAGLVLGIQFLAGFAQVAFYSGIFYLVYFLYGLIVRKELKSRDLGMIIMAFMLAMVIFLPQFLLSWPLAEASGRSSATLGFALWGSFSPFNFMSAVFPYWIFHGTRFYIGIFSLLFLIVSFLGLRSKMSIRPLFMVLVLSVFLALGKYNPLYVILLKITHFYGFRNPSKILFFGMFAASVLSGWGFTEFFRKESADIRTRSLRYFSIFLSVMLGLFFIAKGILALFKDKIIQMGEWYVTRYVHGKDFHRHEPDIYISKIHNFYEIFLQRTSLKDPFILISIVLCVAAFIFVFFLLKKKEVKSLYKWSITTFIFLDIFAFSFYGTGFKGNIKNFDVLEPDNASIFRIVSGDKSMFRILPYGLTFKKMPNWTRPNENMIYGIDSVAAYTPLVSDMYYNELKGLEAVDNSLGLLRPSPGILEGKRGLLRLLNVKYIVSSEKIEKTFMKKIKEDNGIYLYELTDALPRGYLVRDLDEPADIAPKKAKMIEYRSGYSSFMVDATDGGYLVLSEFNYPGWHARIEGKDARIERFRDILMAVRLPKGQHKVEFMYSPFRRERYSGRER